MTCRQRWLLLGEEKVPGTRGRPPVSVREVLEGILYVLRTGCQWKALPKEYGPEPPSTLTAPGGNLRNRLILRFIPWRKRHLRERAQSMITCSVTKVNDEKTLLALLDLLARQYSVKATYLQPCLPKTYQLCIEGSARIKSRSTFISLHLKSAGR
jgi:transposase